MDSQEKVYSKFFDEFKEIDLKNCLDYVYKVMFTSYIKKTLSETRKNYFIKEKKYKDSTVCFDSNELLDFESKELEKELNLCVESSIEDFELYECIQMLTSKQKRVLFNYYLENKNEVEISKELCISRQAVNRIRKRALLFIKKYYKGTGARV